MLRFDLFLILLVSCVECGNLTKPRIEHVNLLEDKVDLNQVLYSIALSPECRESVVSGERKCYIDHLDRFSSLFPYSVNDDPSSEFERKTCCALWEYFDCLRYSVVASCSQDDVNTLDEMPSNWNNVYVAYCAGYEYGTHYCYIFPLTIIIIFAIFLTAFICFTIGCLVWYWRKGARNNMEHYRRRRIRTAY